MYIRYTSQNRSSLQERIEGQYERHEEEKLEFNKELSKIFAQKYLHKFAPCQLQYATTNKKIDICEQTIKKIRYLKKLGFEIRLNYLAVSILTHLEYYKERNAGKTQQQIRNEIRQFYQRGFNNQQNRIQTNSKKQTVDFQRSREKLMRKQPIKKQTKLQKAGRDRNHKLQDYFGKLN